MFATENQIWSSVQGTIRTAASSIEGETPENWLVNVPAPPGTHLLPDLIAWGFDWCEDETPENWLVDTPPPRSRKPVVPRSLPSPKRPSPLTARDWSTLPEGCTPWDRLVPGPSPAA